MPNKDDVMRWQQQDTESACFLPWSEFAYHLFSHLISDECPRELAMGIEHEIFAQSWLPFENRLEDAINALINTDGPEEANEKLTELLIKWKG